jgi:4-diphosphocytidyl-2-C-methyl-D-erythritol kinase
MVAFPGCKINLGLHVLHRRPDGFHDIDTCFYPVPWSDVLEFLPADDYAFSNTGLPITGDPEQNLCVRAYQLLRADYALPPVQGHLHKIVPLGAGLGGGSADAAHTLRLLNSIFELNLPLSRLVDYARQLGSDCAFFLTGTPARGTGKGDVLQPMNVDLEGYFLVVVTPPLQVSTAEAYRGVKPSTPLKKLEVTLATPVDRWRDSLNNDFEATIFPRYPEIRILKEKMYAKGAVYASMSGSGSSVFGLFSGEVSREELFAGLTGWSGWL